MKEREKASIPVYSIQERNKSGLEILQVESFQAGESSLQTAHRDDHYIFVFQEKGTSKVMVDFKEVSIEGAAVFCILPGQVHYGIAATQSLAWFIAVDASWLSEVFRPVFEESAEINKPIPLSHQQACTLASNIVLLQEVYEKGSQLHFHHHMLRSLMDACISQFASLYYSREQSSGQAHLRTAAITRQFRSLLLQNFRSMKSPSDYAASLHISPSYLNEAVKQTSGYPVSYWIQQEIILEAKRMLFYTEHTVKEIAHALGYDDHTYFIRLFGKTAGISPQRFRKQYRE
ncbi:helix-turn-helix domain-containing protein [Cesiribacter sp. SM1]|uniref:helix-turn-helix domain-containing protein n=1 Tax=Cesiribacter sp. SM1 TaxID=2861196 RepID=UPI001CD73B18